MRYLFIDRDGTLIEEPPDTQQIDSYERFRLLPGVLSALKWAQQVGYRLVMITNQDGLGTSSFPEAAFWGPQRLLLDICSSEGIVWEGIHIDRSRAASPSFYRKPSPLLLLPYIERGIDRERSFVIGDRATDMELARRLGLRGIWLHNPLHPKDEESFPPEMYPRVRSWAAVQEVLQSALFSVSLRRHTRETRVSLSLRVHGRGEREIATGVGFLDHMMELLAYHAGWDLYLQAEGDLHVDAHHTMEDVAIVLGQALRQVVGDKRGLERYGQSANGYYQALPMDEALAWVVLDLSGRGLLQWQVQLPEGVGGLPASLWRHFFETLAREGGITLHLHAQGEDGHHIVEALFKGTGRALRQALRPSYERYEIPSTKGLL